MQKLVLCALTMFVVAGGLLPTLHSLAHNGGILIQLQDNKLAIGADSEVAAVPPNFSARVFTSLLSDEYYTQSLPSFLSRHPAPTGTQEIPAGARLYWDFLPMSIDGQSSNLWYWPGGATTSESVEFTQPSQDGLNLGLYNVTDSGDNRSAVVTGTAEMVQGGLLGVADTFDNALRLHRHNYFVLDDGDGVTPTNVPEGVYLLSMQLRIEGAAASDPFFILAGTYDLISTSLESLDAAALWVEQNQERLIVAGDYNFDGVVDAGDYAVWKEHFGATGPFHIEGTNADGNRDGVVNLADYSVWRNQLGASGATSRSAAISSTTAVPEPTTRGLAVLTLVILWWQPWQYRSDRTTLREAGRALAFRCFPPLS